MQEAANAAYAAEGGLAGHLAQKRARKKQRQEDAAVKAAIRASRRDLLDAELRGMGSACPSRRRQRSRSCVLTQHGCLLACFAVKAAWRDAALKTPRAARYLTSGHADIEAVALETLAQVDAHAVAASLGGAAKPEPVAPTPPPPLPPAAAGGMWQQWVAGADASRLPGDAKVKREVFAGASTPQPESRRRGAAAPADELAELRAKRLRAMEARGVAAGDGCTAHEVIELD